MFISIQPESTIPIYEQLALEIKKGIVRDEILPRESLPSVRVLAGDIGINMHTVNKTYKNLVAEGVLVQGKKGFKVNEAEKILRTDLANEKITHLLYELIIQKELYQLSDSELKQMEAAILAKIHKREGV